MFKTFFLQVCTTVVCMMYLCISNTFAQWNSIFSHFDNADYGIGSMTWCICTEGQNTLFANQKAMLYYDGCEWGRLSVKNDIEIWSIVISKNKKCIYIGGWEEFGYFSLDNMGILHYLSITDSLGGEYKRLGNVYSVHESNDVVFARCSNHVIVKNGDKYTIHKTPYRTTASTVESGILYVATEHGIYFLAGSKLLHLTASKILDGKHIGSMVPYKKGLLIATENDGLYYFDGENLSLFPLPAGCLLNNVTVRTIDVCKDRLAIGTLTSGLIVINLADNTYIVYDESNSLQNNSVKSLKFDDFGNLWVGMDYGIDYIAFNSPFSNLYSRPHSYGVGYTAQLYNGLLYFGTSRGLYSTPFPVVFNGVDANISKVDIPRGNARVLYKFKDELLCFHDKGIYSITGDNIKKVTSLVGAWACAPVKDNPDKMFVGLFQGLAIIEKTPKGWIERGRVKGIDNQCRWIRQDQPGHIKVFARHSNTCVDYTLSPDLLRVIKKDTINESFTDIHAEEINEIFRLGEPSLMNAITIDKRYQIIPYSEGFAMLDRSKLKVPNSETIIRTVYSINDGVDSIIMKCAKIDRNFRPKIDYRNNSLLITYSVFDLLKLCHFRYQYRINGGSWSPLSKNNRVMLKNLREGDYTFEVRAINFEGHIMTDSIRFSICPPWYRSVLAYLLYFLMIVFLLVLLQKQVKRYVAKKHRVAFAQKDKELEKMHDEIERLEQDKQELAARRKEMEMANLIMNVARKNEILIDIKNDIKKIINRMKIDTPSQSKMALTLVTGKISDNLEGDEVLKKFEEQYDLLNDRFMQKLSELHPKLSSNERLMCAYLHMDLSTKEIAPLLNISLRGVETMRYRLRKKLDVMHDQSLTDYFNSIG